MASEKFCVGLVEQRAHNVHNLLAVEERIIVENVGEVMLAV
jgi:hypothetical protein